MTPRLTRREAIAAGIFAGVAASASPEDAATGEPDPKDDIRPTLPLSERQARTLLRPAASQADHHTR